MTAQQQPPPPHHQQNLNHDLNQAQQQQQQQQPRRTVGNDSAQIRTVDLRAIPAIEKYAYCLCLHVKPTTIFISVFKLIRALLFASILLNTEFSMNEQAHELHSIEDRNRSTVAAVNILTRVITASVSAVGIYAVISGRAALLMPLYAMMLVDFFFALPPLYSHDFDSTFADNWTDLTKQSTRDSGGGYSGVGGSRLILAAGNDGGASSSEQYARYSLMLFSTTIMVIEIYFLCVVWKCYRYLRLIELITPIRLSELYTHALGRAAHPPHNHHQQQHPYPIVRVLGEARELDDQLDLGSSLAPPPYNSIALNMKPPNYEEAMKSTGLMLPVETLISIQQQQQQQHDRSSETSANRATMGADELLPPPPQYAQPEQAQVMVTAAQDQGQVNHGTSSSQQASDGQNKT